MAPPSETAGEADEPRRRRFVVFPLLVAAWPVLFLYGQNAGEVRTGEALRAAALVVGVAAIVLVILTLGLRDARRAGLVTAVLALSVLVYGHVETLLGEPPWLFTGWVAVTVVVVVTILLIRRSLVEVTKIVAGMAVVLVALAVLPVVQATSAAANAVPTDPDAAVSVDDVPGWAGDGEPRDIYYLIFDRYGSEESLRQRFGWDNGPFTRALHKRGFFVAGESRANHLRTAQSLASSLNMRYLLDFTERYGTETDDLLPVYELLQDHALGRVLKAKGYEYVHIGAWWDPTEHNDFADVNLGFERQSDFLATLWDTTLVAEVRRPPAQLSGEQRRYGAYLGTLDQLRQLRNAARRPGPTFTFAHVLLPHQPFVFDANGAYQDLQADARRGHDVGYIEQLQYTNDQILAFVDDVLDVPADERPLVVIQADEGPHPLEYLRERDDYRWQDAPDAELLEKFAILNALYLPPVSGIEVPSLTPTATPVNTWRLLLNAYFGADLELLPERSYAYRDDLHVYDFVDVTERLR
jgi:hypothetical protein